MNRHELLNKINEVSFVVNDLTLFLDTHPTDEQALTLFDTNSKERKRLLEEYESSFEPLTIDCIKSDSMQNDHDFCQYSGQKHFTWVDGPTPWEGGHI